MEEEATAFAWLELASFLPARFAFFHELARRGQKSWEAES